MKRHQLILDKLNEQKYVTVIELCEELDVSAVTIRKDLNLLEEKGLLYRTHGGASLESPYIRDRHINEKEKIYVEEKKGIAQAAAKLIEENDTIIIASGTTLHAFAKHIQPKNKLSVITASLPVATELANFKDIEILQLGGYVRHSSVSVTGSMAETLLQQVSCDKLFIGADGVDLSYGLTTSNLPEADLNKKMMAASQKVVLLVDSSKFGKKSFAKICELEDIHEIITDKGIGPKMAQKLKEHGIKIHIV